MAQDEWIDEAAGPLVRPYVRTGGRTEPVRTDLDISTQVVATPGARNQPNLSVNDLAVIAFCSDPLSVAEIASMLDVPLLMARVLVSDLLHGGSLILGSQNEASDATNVSFLQEVLQGVRNL